MVEDDPDLEEEDAFMSKYQEERMKQLHKVADERTFGAVREFDKTQWDHEVSRAPEDVYVIVHLYQDYVDESMLLAQILAKLAPKHPKVKILKICATKAIENYQDVDVPGMLIYKNGDIEHQLIPCANKFGGLKMSEDTVEFVLALKGVMETEIEEDPMEKILFKTKIYRARQKNEDESDEEKDAAGRTDREYCNNQYHFYKR